MNLIQLAKDGLHNANWYDKALFEIDQICELEGWNRERFINILSILSPRVQVRRNVRMALKYISTGTHYSGTLTNIISAVKKYEETSKVNGPKVTAFAKALKGDNEAIVLDVWMARALKVEQKKLKNKGIQKKSQKAIHKVAKKIGLSPRNTQAAIWAGIIQKHNGKPNSMPIIEEYKKWKTNANSVV